jgi:serine/threonine protein kinase
MTATRLPAIPGYDILERLDAGGMGVVYKARQQALDRLTAIKFMLARPATDLVAVARFLREAKAAARLSHPAIVQIHDVSQADGIPYIVMEYVDGLNLAKLTALRGPLPASEACRIVRDVALGLQHAHEHGLVHRDIKPSNLLMASRERQRPEGFGKVKILDFGLARLQGAEGDFGLTHSDQPLGTPDFIAPEQIDDPRAADVRSDLYSLGCTFYFLLTGRAPFAGGSLARKLDGHRWDAPTPLRELLSNIPAEIASVVQRLLAKQPNERPGSASDLAETLNRLLADLPSNDSLTSVPANSVKPGPCMSAVTLPQADQTDGACRRLTGHVGAVTCVTVSANGNHLASGSVDGTAILWDRLTGQCHHRLSVGAEVVSLALAPLGQVLLTGGRDGRIGQWDAASGRCLRWFEGHRGPIHALAVLPDGKQLLSAGADQTIRQWRLDTGRAGRAIGGTVAERHWGAVLALAVSPEGRVALSASQDRTCRVWDLVRRRELRCFREHRATVRAVACAPDGKLALSSDDEQAILWELATGQVVGRLEGLRGTITSLAFLPDGDAVVAGCGSLLLVRNLTGSQPHYSLAGHRSEVSSVAVSRSGWMASGGTDSLVCLWPINEKRNRIRPGA